MSKKMKKMTLKELRPFVADYHKVFDTWSLVKPEILVRESGPVLQYIGFERLSWGDYRPSSAIYVMCVPERDGAGCGPQLLNVKVRSIDPRAHGRLYDKVVEAMKSEFFPRVEESLIPEVVLDLFEEQAVPKSPEAVPLAALNAYFGHDNRALYWCERFSQLVEELGHGWQEWDIRRRTFLEQLAEWIRNGQAKERLEEILQAERKSWGLQNAKTTLQGK